MIGGRGFVVFGGLTNGLLVRGCRMGSTTAGMGGGGWSLGDMVAGAGVESGVRPCTSAGSRSKLMKLVIFSCLVCCKYSGVRLKCYSKFS